MNTKIYYRGFEIKRTDCMYLINGLLFPFSTLEKVKAHIDWIKDKEEKTKNQKHFYE